MSISHIVWKFFNFIITLNIKVLLLVLNTKEVLHLILCCEVYPFPSLLPPQKKKKRKRYLRATFEKAKLAKFLKKFLQRKVKKIFLPG